MNIVTYATPVSVRPDRVWSLGLYKDTLSYDNFCRERSCILQLLTERHVALVKVLGGLSGRDVVKKEECQRRGFEWGSLPPGEGERSGSPVPLVLPSCAYYLKLTAIGDIVDCGSHSAALCTVKEMFVSNDGEQQQRPTALSTAKLRELGIITEQGRVADDE